LSTISDHIKSSNYKKRTQQIHYVSVIFKRTVWEETSKDSQKCRYKDDEFEHFQFQESFQDDKTDLWERKQSEYALKKYWQHRELEEADCLTTRRNDNH